MTDADLPQTARRRVGFAGIAVLLACLLAALGVWQLERREWKHALIAAVEQRIHSAPVAAPAPTQWRNLTPERDAYRRISATGRFLYNRETLVRAVTDLGSGYWVLTPLETRDFTVIVNRGFVPPEKRDIANHAAGEPSGPVTVTGLLRMTEPGGGFLRRNDPAADRWYSRDIAAIAQKRRIHRTAPYFIDADAAPNPGGYPVGGLTVVRFPDNHMVYALTCFGLALLACWWAWYSWRIPAISRPVSA